MSKNEHDKLIIVDLGSDGVTLYDTIAAHVKKTANIKMNTYSVTKMVHKSIIEDLVYFLNIPPAEALDNVQSLVNFSYQFEIMDMFRIKEMDVFNSAIKPLVLNIYLKVRSQFKVRINVQYSPKKVRLDHVVIREVHSTLDKNQNLNERIDTLGRYYRERNQQ